MQKVFRLLSCACLFSLPAFSQNNYSFPVRTTIENGVIEGRFDTKSELQEYFGIPYARPPVGPLRWKAPAPAANWQGVLATKKFAPRPVQAPVFSDMRFRSGGMSEDCLYLNVWTPKKNGTKNLPVLVYFYGGGFVAGGSSERRYDGASMAKKGMVVVTVNYRLGIFGFFAYPGLSEESPYKGCGNYGLLDQVAALEWVQRNIAAFGGDPHAVTIAGESAGSISVSFLMASPLSKNLFARAIGESGAGINPTQAPVPLATAEKNGQAFAEKAGYHSLAALRKLSTRALYEIYTESKRFSFPVVIDGYYLKATLPEVFARRQQAMVPLLAGWNSAESGGGGFMQGLPYTEENFLKKVKQAAPDHYSEILKRYPHHSDGEVEQSATDLASQRFITYSTWKWIDLQCKNSGQPVYRYLFSHIRPRGKDPDHGSGSSRPNGARHATEIEYCLGELNLSKYYDWAPDDYKVSATMQDYFANFILHGDPNGGSLPQWPAVQPGDPQPYFMDIDLRSKAMRAAHDDQFRLLDSLYAHKDP